MSERGSENVLVINTGRRASYLTVISGTDLLFDQEVAFGDGSGDIGTIGLTDPTGPGLFFLTLPRRILPQPSTR